MSQKNLGHSQLAVERPFGLIFAILALFAPGRQIGKMKAIGQIPRKLLPFESTPGHPRRDPSLIFVIIFYSIFFHQTMDAIDGKQARRTGSGRSGILLYYTFFSKFRFLTDISDFGTILFNTSAQNLFSKDQLYIILMRSTLEIGNHSIFVMIDELFF